MGVAGSAVFGDKDVTVVDLYPLDVQLFYVKRLIGKTMDDLLKRLSLLLPNCRLESTAAYGIHPDGVEAVLFAWLARERLARRLQDTGSITGARESILLGEIFRPAHAPTI